MDLSRLKEQGLVLTKVKGGTIVTLATWTLREHSLIEGIPYEEFEKVMYTAKTMQEAGKEIQKLAIKHDCKKDIPCVEEIVALSAYYKDKLETSKIAFWKELSKEIDKARHLREQVKRAMLRGRQKRKESKASPKRNMTMDLPYLGR